jgi:branched-subunit amino acid aminotransferase/4-amino-4-deoxychorismate lyase
MINLDGKLLLENEVNIKHTNFRFAYGAIASTLITVDKIYFFTQQISRLLASCNQLNICCKSEWNLDFWRLQLNKTFETITKQHEYYKLRIQIFKTIDTHFVVSITPIELDYLNPENGISLYDTENFIKKITPESFMKISHNDLYIHAATQLKEHKNDQIVVFNTKSELVETNISNIFLIQNNDVFTPKLNSGCVAGIMREWIIEYLKTLNIKVFETTLTKENLLHADEVFLTNSVRFIKNVHSYETKKYSRSKTNELFNTKDLLSLLPYSLV